jgi:hypothetical protein
MRATCVAIAAALAIACGGSTSPTGPSGAASLNIMLTDSPFSDAKAVLVTFSEVSVHLSDMEWKTVPFSGGSTSRTCDLKKLESGAQDVLGVGALTPGQYTQIRLTVSSAAIYFDNASTGSACAPSIAAPAGQSAALTIPSGEVKLNRQFELTATDATTMVLDFDGDRSIHETGNGRYMMSPVISVVSVR